jgi:hypothetical protein
MRALRAIGAIALADFRERTRRQGFLVAVAMVAWVAYMVASGQLSFRLDQYQGVMNAPWLGSVLAFVVCTVLGWLGFFLVNRAVDMDRRSGVGELLAASPISRMHYTLAKWLANFALLGLLVGVLLAASLLLHWRNMSQIAQDLPALFAPILIVAVPVIALTAACAVLFESVHRLRGALGNVLWLFGFTQLFLVSVRLGALDLTGFGLLVPSMQAAAKAALPAYGGGYVLGFAPHRELQLFHWGGIDWSLYIVLLRSLWLVPAALLALLASVCFDRFDRAAAPAGRPGMAAAVAPQGHPVADLPPTAAPAVAVLRFSPAYRLLTEVSCLLQGTRLWWWLVALGLAIAGFAVSSPLPRGMLLLASWVWPVTVWSQMGSREARDGTDETVFSSPHPLLLQLPGQWLAGFVLAVLTGGGVLLHLVLAGDTAPLLAALVGAALIPSLALCLGVLTGTAQVFEVLYLLLCYVGPLQGVAALDFMRARGSNDPAVWGTIAVASLAVAFVWRWRQLQR